MKKAVFLDRDGVINEVLSSRVKFVNKPEDFHLLPHVGEAVKLLNDSDFLVFVVTNQGGVGLGYMKEAMLNKVHARMKELIAVDGGEIDDVMYCPHKPKEGCLCRKPEPGMLLTLMEKYNVDLSASYMIGDRDVDLIAGKGAGIKTILVGKREDLLDTVEPDLEFEDLLSAAKYITNSSS